MTVSTPLVLALCVVNKLFDGAFGLPHLNPANQLTEAFAGQNKFFATGPLQHALSLEVPRDNFRGRYDCKFRQKNRRFPQPDFAISDI